MAGKIISDFETRFDNLTADKNNYGDVIEMLASAIHSEKVKQIVIEKYLEYKGYNVEDLAEEGKKLISNLIESGKNKPTPQEDR